MKKIIYILLIATSLSACKFDDDPITIGYTTTYMVNQDYNRNLVVGEGLQMNVGVTLAGVVSNKSNRKVYLEVDPTLVTASGKQVLPSSYYTLDHDYIIIPKGKLLGTVRVKIDSTAFLADPLSLPTDKTLMAGSYVLPLKISKVEGIDKITDGKGYICISVSYFARQHGNYTYSGTLNAGGTVTEFANTSTNTNSVRKLTTIGSTKFLVEGDATNAGDPITKHALALWVEIPTSGSGAVQISSDPTSAIAVTADGESTYEAASKTLWLNYQYTLADGTVCKVAEKLVFRNRIRDVQSNGIYLNEWRGF